MHDEQEIKSDNVLPAGLWTRANFKANDSSPFGLCVDNTKETNELFRNAFKYQPHYFPGAMTIDILNNDHNLCLPLIFRLPFKRDRQKQSKSSSHQNGIKSLTKAVFEFTAINEKSLLDYFESEATIHFSKADEIWLTLIFDKAVQGRAKQFADLRLTILY